jgi:hypothetical protein
LCFPDNRYIFSLPDNSKWVTTDELQIIKRVGLPQAHRYVSVMKELRRQTKQLKEDIDEEDHDLIYDDQSWAVGRGCDGKWSIWGKQYLLLRT